MSDVQKRAGDPDDFDPGRLRDPVQITISRKELALGLSHRRAILWGVLAGTLSGIVVSAVMGFYVTGQVTHTVRHDVGKAAVRNCKNAKASADALSSFLSTDAEFNRQLGALDVRSAAIDRDLAASVAALGRALPRRIATDYQKQSDVFQQLAADRADIAGLWAGSPAKRNQSLLEDVLGAATAHCGTILEP